MEADASTLDMPSDCCYFVEKAAAAGAAPAFQYFDSIFHHFAVVTQNLGQTRLFARRRPRNSIKAAPLSCFYGIQPLLQCAFPLERRGAPVEDARFLDNFVQKPCT